MEEGLAQVGDSSVGTHSRKVPAPAPTSGVWRGGYLPPWKTDGLEASEF